MYKMKCNIKSQLIISFKYLNVKVLTRTEFEPGSLAARATYFRNMVSECDQCYN